MTSTPVSAFQPSSSSIGQWGAATCIAQSGWGMEPTVRYFLVFPSPVYLPVCPSLSGSRSIGSGGQQVGNGKGENPGNRSGGFSFQVLLRGDIPNLDISRLLITPCRLACIRATDARSALPSWTLGLCDIAFHPGPSPHQSPSVTVTALLVRLTAHTPRPYSDVTRSLPRLTHPRSLSLGLSFVSCTLFSNSSDITLTSGQQQQPSALLPSARFSPPRPPLHSFLFPSAPLPPPPPPPASQV